MNGKIAQHFHARSVALLSTLEQRLEQIFLGWMMLVALACAALLLLGPVAFDEAIGTTGWTYVLLIVTPVASALLALRWFEDGDNLPQPAFRLARVGRWRGVSPAEARRHPLYGTSGIMVSLLIGMLLNVPFRTMEFLLAVPPITQGAPEWVHTLQAVMAVDAVLFSSLYVIAFVTALKRVPLFPRLLVFIWLADIAMQLLIAGLIGSSPDLPAGAASSLHQLLNGAIQKVLISICVWAPYLLLSRRVNVTYRLRVPG
jgi:hypothetical protein